MVAIYFLADSAQATMYWARPYDPNLQRWVTQDPIGERGGMNLYGFVVNDPVNEIDPLGLDNQYDMASGNNAPPSVGFTAPVNRPWLVEPVMTGGDDLLGMPNGAFVSFVPGYAFGAGALSAPGNIYGGIRDACNSKINSLDRWAGGLNAFGNSVLLAATFGLKGDPCPPAKSPPKPSPNFQPPTNPPQLPPANLPPSWKLFRGKPTQQYPDGYWKITAPQPGGGPQPINPSTMKPAQGGRPDYHVAFPPGYKGPFDN